MKIGKCNIWFHSFWKKRRGSRPRIPTYWLCHPRFVFPRFSYLTFSLGDVVQAQDRCFEVGMFMWFWVGGSPDEKCIMFQVFGFEVIFDWWS